MMENQPKFVKDLKTNNIDEITDMNRHYYNKVVPLKPELVYLDQYEQLIGTLDLTEKEAELFVEEKLRDLVDREEKSDAREKRLTDWENELVAREEAVVKKEIKKTK